MCDAGAARQRRSTGGGRLIPAHIRRRDATGPAATGRQVYGWARAQTEQASVHRTDEELHHPPRLACLAGAAAVASAVGSKHLNACMRVHAFACVRFQECICMRAGVDTRI